MHKTKKLQIGGNLSGASLLYPLQNGGSSFAPQPANPSSLIQPLSGSGGNGLNAGGISSILANNSSFLKTLFGTADSVLPSLDRNVNSRDAATGAIRSGINQTLLTSGNPWAMAAGGINTAIDKLGGFSDASQGLGKGTDTLNSIASLALPGAGWFTRRTEKYNQSDTLKGADGYTGTSANATTAEQNAGAKLLFGRNKANNMIRKSRRQDNQVQDIMDRTNTAFQSAASNAYTIGNRNAFARAGGYNQSLVRVGKVGLKFPDLKRIEELSTLCASKFAEGGKMNVIPDGALHSRKHSIELDNITKKGIPVITESDGGTVIQQAEVEKNEIIFTKEVTTELERLYNLGTDEAAIEAGKLISKEIIENTQDNTGLIAQVS